MHDKCIDTTRMVYLKKHEKELYLLYLWLYVFGVYSLILGQTFEVIHGPYMMILIHGPCMIFLTMHEPCVIHTWCSHAYFNHVNQTHVWILYVIYLIDVWKIYMVPKCTHTFIMVETAKKFLRVERLRNQYEIWSDSS